MKIQEDFLWQTILEEIKKSVTPHQFQTWFTSLRLLAYSKDRIDIQVPNVFFKDWLERRYLERIQKAVATATGYSEAPAEAGGTQCIPNVHFHAESINRQSATLTIPADGNAPFTISSHLNKKYRFEGFIIGPCNRLAHAAALAVAELPGRAYNPLFIHAASGLGKTHLLHAICLLLLERQRHLKVAYVPCEAFVNHFIATIKSNDWDSFRRCYRDIDVLAIDDIHFLSHSQRTREEFFHTFNALYNSQKQIVLSSDCPPEEIPTLEERLVSRFKWGLMCRIDSPAYETRVAIIEKKAGEWGIELPTDVVKFVADRITTNIREIEGAIVRIVKCASIANTKVSLALAQESVSELIKERKCISIEQILKVVTTRYNIQLSLLQSRRKTKSVTFPRQIAMHLARRLTGLSLNEIGGYLGGRDHTTVIHADEKIHSLREKDQNLNELLQNIENTLQKQ